MNPWFPRLHPITGEVANAKVPDHAHEPVWLGDDIVFHINNGGTHSLANGKIDDRELVEKAAGGGWLAARYAPGNVLVLISPEGIKTEIHNAGQPALSPSGKLIYRAGDDKVEPTISDTHSAWGDGRGRIFSPEGEITVAGPEGRPKLFDANGKTYLLTMTDKQLRVREWGEQIGWTRIVGEDRNLNSDFRVIATQIEIVSNDKPNGGTILHTHILLSEEKRPFNSDTVVQPEPQPDPQPEPEEPRVSIPNLFHVVQKVDQDNPHLLQKNDAPSCTEFLYKAALALEKEDPKFGLLSKSDGENGTVIDGIRVAVDAVAYKDSDEVVDIMRGVHDGPGQGGISWNVDHRRPTNLWVKVPKITEPEPLPEEPEEPTEPSEPDYEGLLEEIIKRITLELKSAVEVEVKGLRDDLANLQKELDTLTFEGKHRLLGTITFTRKKVKDGTK